MIDLLYSIVSFVIVISVTVFIHEFGHFYVARLCKIKVEIFSIGFGPAICKWRDKYGTEFRINAVPLGGYIRMFGDQNPASVPDFESVDKMTSEEKSVAFYHKPLWQKAAVVAAGPFANYLLAMFLMAFIFCFYGKVGTTNQISNVYENSLAENAGLRPGDVIVGINGHRVHDVFDIKTAIAEVSLADGIHLDVSRDGNFYECNIENVAVNDSKNVVLGVSFQVVSNKLNFFDASVNAVYDSYKLSVMMLKTIYGMISLKGGLNDVGGPIKIAQYSGESMKRGLQPLIWIIAMISLNLGLVNLLPIPMLDGGHLMYYLIEYIAGRPVNVKLQQIGFKIGFALLLALMLFTMLNDIKGLLD